MNSASSTVRAGLGRLAAASLSCLALWMLWEAQRLMQADWGSVAAREQVVEWVASGQGAPVGDDAAWQSAVEALNRSLQITPRDPDLHERLGDAYLAAGQRDAADAAVSQRHFNRAAGHYEQATVYRPGEPGTWAALAAARQAAGLPAAEVHAAWRRALELGPYEGHVQPVLLQVVLADWDAAPPALQAWATVLFDASTPAVRRQINVLARRYGLQFSADDAAPKP